MNPQDLDTFKIPVSDEYKILLAKTIISTAEKRESSYVYSSKKGRGEYALTINAAALITDSPYDVAKLAAHCLEHCWNDALDWCETKGLKPRKV
jgi:hypothetical protein